MQAYGAMQHTLRKMTKADNDRYSAPGTEGYDRYQVHLTAAHERYEYRERAIKRFIKDNEVVVGNLRGCTLEDVELIKAARTAYEQRLKAFKTALDKTHPDLRGGAGF
jgi:phosphatidylserine/phosphatidylglycerophosphate/cardiolipin synthase-like enzyme